MAPGSARASVDFTGTWVVVAESIAGSFVFEWTVVQTGTDLSLTSEAEGGSPQGPYDGTIDPATGVFVVPLPDTFGPFPGLVCTGNQIAGTVAADGQTVSGTSISQFWKTTPPPGCFDTGGPYTGHRVACGDGATELDEVCDDGNVADGDCCSAACDTQAVDGTACIDDDPCTTADQCSAGTCAGTPLACAPCEVCGASGCEVPSGCQPALAGKAKITMTAAASPAGDRLAWTWKSSGAVALDDFGDPPADTDVTLCVIDQTGGVPSVRLSATAPAGGTCGSKAGWKVSTKGYAYKDPEGTPDGLITLRLRAGATAGSGKMVVKGKGVNLGAPADALTPPVVVRVLRSDAPTCWESSHSTPKLNAGGRFKASSD